MVRIDFQNFLEIREWVVISVGCEHLGLLDFIHECAVAVAVSHYYAWLACQSV